MATTKETLNKWFDAGVAQGATHMIIVCDTFDHGDFPVYVKPGEDVREREKLERNAPMQKIMEIYNMSMDKARQLNEHRAFHR